MVVLWSWRFHAVAPKQIFKERSCGGWRELPFAVSILIPRILSRFRVGNNSVRSGPVKSIWLWKCSLKVLLSNSALFPLPFCSQLGPMVTGSERNHPLQQLPSSMATKMSAKQDRPRNKTAPTQLPPCHSISTLPRPGDGATTCRQTPTH